MATYKLIESQVLGSSAASVTFSAIPATYTDLVLKWSCRTNSSSSYYNSNLEMLVNGSATSIYSYTLIRGNGSGASASAQNAAANTYLPITAGANNDTATANTFASGEVYLPNYNSTAAYKPFSIFAVTETNAAVYPLIIGQASLINSTSPITSLTVTAAGWSFVANSSFNLYGISNTI